MEVTFGVQNGKVFGNLLFMLFINNIGENASSTLQLLANHCLIYKHTRTQLDMETLQQNLDPVSWSKK